MRKITPTTNRIFVKSLPREKITTGGIVLPESVEEEDIQHTAQGEITAVGPDVKNVKTGDKILFIKGTNPDVKLYGQEFTILESQDVLGVIT